MQPDALVAIERAGQAADGTYRTQRAFAMKGVEPIDQVFDLAGTQRRWGFGVVVTLLVLASESGLWARCSPLAFGAGVRLGLWPVASASDTGLSGPTDAL